MVDGLVGTRVSEANTRLAERGWVAEYYSIARDATIPADEVPADWYVIDVEAISNGLVVLWVHEDPDAVLPQPSFEPGLPSPSPVTT